MNNIELYISALNATANDESSFVVLLQDVNSSKKISLIIGHAEAQSIAIALEKLEPPRPLTHDLLMKTIAALKARLTYVKITAIKDGYFEAIIGLKDASGTTLEIDSRSSDALALAVRQKCSILIDSALFNDISFEDKEQKERREKLQKYSLAQLQALLADTLAKEDFETAGMIRDIVNERS